MKPNDKSKKIEVFLGGTTAKDTDWREKLIDKLDVDYFNPVVDDWDETAYKRELRKRKTCDFILYVITPLMEGVYSIAEVTDDSNKRPDRTIFCVLKHDGHDKKKSWTPSQLKSLDAVKKMVEGNGATVLESLDEIAEFLNRVKI